MLVAAARTPFGKLGGGLSTLSAPDLGAVVIKEVLARAQVEGADVDQVIMGTVITAGMGQIPARQAAIKAGLPTSVPALSVNKVCASSLKAVNLAALLIRNGDAEVVVAGGMENMSQAPYLLDKARFGYRLGDAVLVDSMVRDGLIDPANGCHMAVEGSNVAKEFEVSRERQDEYAYGSQQRYAAALKAGHFQDELVPVAVPNPKGTATVSADEQPRPETTIEGLARLKPVFQADGTITAGNAPGVNDGAAAILLMSGAEAKRRGLRVTGTLGVLRTAAERGLVNVPKLIVRLKATNFYADEALLKSAFGRWIVTRRAAGSTNHTNLTPLWRYSAIFSPISDRTSVGERTSPARSGGPLQ